MLLDCIIYILDPDRTGLKEGDELRLLSILFSHSVSQAVMSEEEASRLSLEQVIKLCKVLYMLIHNPEEVECAEENLMEWVSMLVTSHYMQLVVSRDKATLDWVNKMQETRDSDSQEGVKLKR